MAIRNNLLIEGIKIGDAEAKVLQFEDDTTVFLRYRFCSCSISSFGTFCESITSNVNTSKAEGLWICFPKKNYSKPLGIKWPNEPIKALGVFFTYDNTLLCEKHFRETIVNVKKDMNIWSSRGLSIFGKIVTMKSVLLSKLMYISPLLPTPTYIIKEVNRLLFKFLWKGTCR